MGAQGSYKNCQSCGMPMARDEQGGGTERDGGRSTRYCSHCYQDGAFTLPDASAEQMRARVIQKLQEFHFPGFVARFLTRNLSQLERWQGSAPGASPSR
jgi:hypothetical protein